MNLIKFNKLVDYGTEWQVKILTNKKRSLLQVSVNWMDHPDWPFFQVRLGHGGIFNFVFWSYKFGFEMSILDRTWNYDHIVIEKE